MNTHRRLSLADRLFLLTGDTSMIFGVGFLLAGLLNVSLSWGYLQSQADFQGPLRSATATVTGCTDSGVTENHVKVEAVHYWYRTPDGATRRGVSYGDCPQAGAALPMEYVVAHPNVSRLRGWETSAMSGFTLLGALPFLVAGTCFFVSSLRRGLRAVTLVARGWPAWGVQTLDRPTPSTVNGVRVHLYSTPM